MRLLKILLPLAIINASGLNAIIKEKISFLTDVYSLKQEEVSKYSTTVFKKIASKIKKSDQAFNSQHNVNTEKEKPETTHWSVADKEGNIVVITASLNGPLGSGFVIPKTGILLNYYYITTKYNNIIF